MRTILILVSAISIGTALASGTTFTQEEKKAVIEQCDRNIGTAIDIAHYYQKKDMAFKTLILVLTVTVTVTGIIIAAFGVKARNPLAIVNASLAATVSAISTFALTTVNFGMTSRLYQHKADAFTYLWNEIRLGDPDKETFIKKLNDTYDLGKDPKELEKH